MATHTLQPSGVGKVASLHCCFAPRRAAVRGATSSRRPSLQAHQRCRRSLHCVAGDLAAQPAQAQPAATPAERTVSLTLRKPLGLVLGEPAKGAKGAVVEEVVPGGNADKSGAVRVGDRLSRCSATVLKAGKEGEYERVGHGARLYDNWDRIMFDCENHDFDTIMSAISSNTERWGILDVKLEFKRPVVNS